MLLLHYPQGFLNFFAFFVFLLELQMLFLFLQPPLLLKSLLLLQLRSLLPLLQQLLFLILNFFHKANPFFFADGS